MQASFPLKEVTFMCNFGIWGPIGLEVQIQGIIMQFSLAKFK